MQSRPKTYGEFESGFMIVNRPGGGVKMITKRKGFVFFESKLKPWNTPAMKTTFLKRLYIAEILMRVNLPAKIRRPEGFELLGARCIHRKERVVICAWKELVDSETGEQNKQLTLSGTWRTGAPYKALLNEVQL